MDTTTLRISRWRASARATLAALVLAASSGCTDDQLVCDSGTCVECQFDGDCAGLADECDQAACVGGVCEARPLPAGTPIPRGLECAPRVCDGRGTSTWSAPRPKGTPLADQSRSDECMVVVCDGQGSTEQVPVAAGAIYVDPYGFVGDCEELVCDGAGHGELGFDPGDGPPDEYECTADTCEPGGGTGHVAKPQGTACYSSLATCDGAGHCRVCASPNDACVEDEGPDNHAQATALDLGSLEHGDPGLARCGLVTPDRPDWFRYRGLQGASFFGGGYEAAYANVYSPTAELEVCQFAACVGGEIAFTCPKGESSAASETGMPGCCGSEFSHVNLTCSGSQTADVLVRVRQVGDSACAQYDLLLNY